MSVPPRLLLPRSALRLAGAFLLLSSLLAGGCGVTRNRVVRKEGGGALRSALAPEGSHRLEPVRIRATTLTLPTYPVQEALEPTVPWRQGFFNLYPGWYFLPARLGTETVHTTYPALEMENAFLKIVVLPHLAGRVYRVIDKRTGTDLFYVNPVMKPNEYGGRKLWYALGGIEFHAHTVEGWSATWSGSPACGVIHLAGAERQGGPRIEVDLRLRRTTAALEIVTRLLNPTPAPMETGYLVNFMLPAERGIEFIVPAREVISFGGSGTFSYGGTLPRSMTRIPWPMYDGKDMRFFRNYADTWGFLLVEPNAPFAGYYDHRHERGMARVYPVEATPGVEFFTFGNKPRFRLYQPKKHGDEGAVYSEIIAHLRPRLDAPRAVIPPYGVRAWTERVVSLAGLGPPRYIDERLVLSLRGRLEEAEDGPPCVRLRGRLRALTPLPEGTLLVRAAGTERLLLEQELELDPRRTETFLLALPRGLKAFDLEIRRKERILHYERYDVRRIVEGRW